MTTLKSINKALPRFDQLRRDYWLHGWSGVMDPRIGYIDAAYADLDEKGNCKNITIYSGPGRSPEHYYSERHLDTVVDITEILEGVLKPEESGYVEPNGRYDITPALFRRYIVGQIKGKIESQLSESESDDEYEPIF